MGGGSVVLLYLIILRRWSIQDKLTNFPWQHANESRAQSEHIWLVWFLLHSFPSSLSSHIRLCEQVVEYEQDRASVHDKVFHRGNTLGLIKKKRHRKTAHLTGPSILSCKHPLTLLKTSEPPGSLDYFIFLYLQCVSEAAAAVVNLQVDEMHHEGTENDDTLITTQLKVECRVSCIWWNTTRLNAHLWA